MRALLVKRWFLLALFAVLALGIGLAEQLEPLSELGLLRNAIVATVLFLMALPLEPKAMWKSLMRPGPPLLAVLVNMGLLPLFAWPFSFWLRGDLGPGLLVAATTPSTLASAAVWTRRAGGNDSVAILVTMATNSTCFFVTPLWLVFLTGEKIESPELSLARMTVKLGLLVVLPMALAQLIRLWKPIGQWATARKIPLSVLAQFGILAMVLLGAIRTGLRVREDAAPSLLAGDLLAMLAVVVGVHLAMFATGFSLARLLGFDRSEQIAVGFAGSQKTLMVGLLLAVSLGVSILPMVAYHVSQLLVDTLIADRLRSRAESGAAQAA